jgi:hypothetical protein
MGYNSRNQVIQFMKTNQAERDWKNVKIIIFDAPQATDNSYAQRLELLKQSKLQGNAL